MPQVHGSADLAVPQLDCPAGDYEAAFAQIDELVAAQAAPQLDYCGRDVLEQRLLAALHEGWGSMTEQEREALDNAHQAWLDRKQDEADLRLAPLIESRQLIADPASTRRIREVARRYRAGRSAPTPIVFRRAMPRARARRERHVARSTSSGDSGDSSSGESDPPPLARLVRAFRRSARGLAVCPVCCDEEIVRSRCPFCRGLGFVGREQRNRYKRGERP